MTNKLRAAAELALEVLVEINLLSIGENAICLPAEIDMAMEALRTALAEQPAEQEPVEASPEFTDTARAALLWVLWHHQGGSSPVGQPIRFALGMGAHHHLNEREIAEAKRWAELTRSTTAEFRAPQPAKPAEQEPVAHAVVEPLRPDEYERKVYVKWVNRPIAGPLYTAPQPAKQPLTDDEMRRIYETPELAGSYFPALKSIVRAIEAAHGIGETK